MSEKKKQEYTTGGLKNRQDVENALASAEYRPSQEVTDAAPPAAEELEGKDFSGGIAALLEQGTTLLGEALRGRAFPLQRSPAGQAARAGMQEPFRPAAPSGG